MLEKIKKLKTLTVFNSLLEDKVINSFIKAVLEKSIEEYSKFVSLLYSEGSNFSRYILDIAGKNENIFLKSSIKREAVPVCVSYSILRELKILRETGNITSLDFKKYLEFEELSDYETEDIDFVSEYMNKVKNIHKCGFGIFEKNAMFNFKDGEFIPIKSADKTDYNKMYGYELQIKRVEENTLKFINNENPANVLLYGDSGTGKSSTVKALVNKYKEQGLRLVEIKKDRLCDLGDIIERLSENPLKFILFIDDLSFASNDVSFGVLKTILEGSATGDANNVCVYATSNRRHLVKENFKDREGDDIHLRETMEEISSLSERFGLSVLYERPDKPAYNNIVLKLAKEYKLDLPEEELIKGAEAFSQVKGGRSPRIAKQFIKSIIPTAGQEEINYE